MAGQPSGKIKLEPSEHTVGLCCSPFVPQQYQHVQQAQVVVQEQRQLQPVQHDQDASGPSNHIHLNGLATEPRRPLLPAAPGSRALTQPPSPAISPPTRGQRQVVLQSASAPSRPLAQPTLASPPADDQLPSVGGSTVRSSVQHLVSYMSSSEDDDDDHNEEEPDHCSGGHHSRRSGGSQASDSESDDDDDDQTGNHQGYPKRGIPAWLDEPEHSCVHCDWQAPPRPHGNVASADIFQHYEGEHGYRFKNQLRCRYGWVKLEWELGHIDITLMNYFFQTGQYRQLFRDHRAEAAEDYESSSSSLSKAEYIDRAGDKWKQTVGWSAWQKQTESEKQSIREMFAKTQLAKRLGFTPNVPEDIDGEAMEAGGSDLEELSQQTTSNSQSPAGLQKKRRIRIVKNKSKSSSSAAASSSTQSRAGPSQLVQNLPTRRASAVGNLTRTVSSRIGGRTGAVRLPPALLSEAGPSTTPPNPRVQLADRVDDDEQHAADDYYEYNEGSSDDDGDESLALETEARLFGAVTMASLPPGVGRALTEMDVDEDYNEDEDEDYVDEGVVSDDHVQTSNEADEQFTLAIQICATQMDVRDTALMKRMVLDAVRTGKGDVLAVYCNALRTASESLARLRRV